MGGVDVDVAAASLYKCQIGETNRVECVRKINPVGENIVRYVNPNDLPGGPDKRGPLIPRYLHTTSILKRLRYTVDKGAAEVPCAPTRLSSQRITRSESEHDWAQPARIVRTH